VKTLIINGSPRKNGDTMTLINEMTKYLNGEYFFNFAGIFCVYLEIIGQTTRPIQEED
jgi:hypothetical protein